MQTRFDPTLLSNLTEFNQGLVYGFQPEPSTKAQFNQASLEEMLTSSTGQYQDLYSAYQWLQDTVLPNIRENGLGAVDEVVFLDWIKTMHGFIAKTLTEANYPDPQDLHSQGAGNFSQDFIVRWRSSNNIMSVVNGYIKGDIPFEYAVPEVQQFEVSKKHASAFLQALDVAKRCPNTILAPSERNLLDNFSNGNPLYFYTMSKLAVLYHGNSKQLKENQRQAIEAVVQLGLPPTLIPAKMKELLKTTLAEWKKLHLESSPGSPDLKKIASFLSKFFKDFNILHPFENANKRTSCCIMNLMLRSLNLPSILLRLPQEFFEDNPASKVAFTAMGTNLDPMTALIVCRIQQELRQPFHHPRMQELNSWQCRKTVLILTITSKFPSFNLKRALASFPTVKVAKNKKLSEFDQSIESSIPSEESTVRNLTICLDNLEKNAPAPKAVLPLVGTLLQAPKSKEEQVQKKMEQLTSVKYWKKNGTDANLQIWREFESKEEALSTHDVLNELNPMVKVSFSRRADNQKHVVMCTNIKIDEILALNQEAAPVVINVGNDSI